MLLIRRIRDLLYEQGFTINGARHRLDSEAAEPRVAARATAPSTTNAVPAAAPRQLDAATLRRDLEEIRRLLAPEA